MNSRISIAATGLAGALLASCYPYQERPGPVEPPPSGTEQTVSSPTQQEIQQQRERARQRAEERARQEASNPRETQETPRDPAPKPPAEPKRDFEFATPVPGKEGFVLSPYNQKVVDVRDIPSGTLVQDPTYPASEKKYFRVP